MISSPYSIQRQFNNSKNIKGQALTEFIILTIVLIPLFLLIPIIAKYQDISHSTLMASRYVAFDSAIRNDSSGTWKSPDQLAGEVQRRFFSNPNAPIKTHDIAGDFQSNQNPFWRDPKNKPLIENFNRDISISFGRSFSSTQANGYIPASDGAPFILKDNFSLPANGIFRSNVSVRIANISPGLKFYAPFDNLDLVVHRSTTLLINGWTASNPDLVQAKLDNPYIYPGGILEPANLIVTPLLITTELFGSVSRPRLGRLDFWTDTVPKDRLRK
jgi:hypothetical protein